MNVRSVQIPVMEAVQLRDAGGSEQLTLRRVPRPRPGTADAVVTVHAASITRGELGWSDRRPLIPSHEVSGVVAELGLGAEGVDVGDEVYGLVDFERNGAAAEYVAVRASDLAPRPVGLSHEEAAAMPLAALTAWQALFDHGRLEAGEHVLVLGAAGGVGSFAVQLAHAHGARVTGVSSPANSDFVRMLGADAVGAASGDVDLLVDTVGGDALDRSLDLVRPGGRLVAVAEPAAAEAVRARELEATYFIVEPNRSQLEALARLAEDGRLRAVVRATYPLAGATEAFRELESGHGRGKVVLRVRD